MASEADAEAPGCGWAAPGLAFGCRTSGGQLQHSLWPALKQPQIRGMGDEWDHVLFFHPVSVFKQDLKISCPVKSSHAKGF